MEVVSSLCKDSYQVEKNCNSLHKVGDTESCITEATSLRIEVYINVKCKYTYDRLHSRGTGERYLRAAA
jgi:hypothetical protein